MSCFSCLWSSQTKTTTRSENNPHSSSCAPGNSRATNVNKDNGGSRNIAAQSFTFRELAVATKNFRQECLLGEGGSGRVYRGQLQGGQVAAVKQLDRTGLQGNKEFLVEVLMVSLLRHKNLVNLIGYCADGDQRLLVYEFMPKGSLEDHLLDLAPDRRPLDWFARMRIAAGMARGLEYLHVKANPPVIYRDLKSSNILLDDEFTPKLSDFGLAKLGPMAGQLHVSSRVMGTYGYSAPEYTSSGQLSVQSDVYSFGVVLLELITGRRAVDPTRPPEEQNLVAWAQPLFGETRRLQELADPLLKKEFPERGLKQAVAIAAMCLQEEVATRPLISDVVGTLEFLSHESEAGAGDWETGSGSHGDGAENSDGGAASGCGSETRVPEAGSGSGHDQSDAEGHGGGECRDGAGEHERHKCGSHSDGENCGSDRGGSVWKRDRRSSSSDCFSL